MMMYYVTAVLMYLMLGAFYTATFPRPRRFAAMAEVAAVIVWPMIFTARVMRRLG